MTMLQSQWIDAPVYEPIPRMCGGKFGYVRHRFPIKGGITALKVYNLQISEAFTRKSSLAWRLNKNGTLEKK